MKKMICSCLAVLMLSGCLTGCNGKNSDKSSGNDNNTIQETTYKDNTGKAYLGKWESYKAVVNGVTYETSYAGFPLSAVAQLEVFEDKTAQVNMALNPRGKTREYHYNWDISIDDMMYLRSPDDGYVCRLEQGQIIMEYAMDDGTDIYLLKVNEFTNNEAPTEPGLDKVDYSGFMGKWEAAEIVSDGVTYTDKLGEYPVYSAFRLELMEDNTSVMSVIGEPQSYEWSPEKKDQLYMWGDFEGFAVRLDGDMLVINDESSLTVKFKRVEDFSDFDFSAAHAQIPDENILLEPEEETSGYEEY